MTTPESYEIDGARFDFVPLDATERSYQGGVLAKKQIEESFFELPEEDLARMVKIVTSKDAGRRGATSTTYVSNELLAKLAVEEKILPKPALGKASENILIEGGASTKLER
jgi:hypothetical protein